MAKFPPGKGTKRPKAATPRQQGSRAGEAKGMTDAIRADIVMRLACYDRVKDIHADLLSQGIDISSQAVTQYNPENGAFNKAKKWRDLFFTTREAFLKELAEVPIAHRAYRMRTLQKILEKEMDRGATALARATLEQAAKEAGNVFTNVQRHTGTIRTTPASAAPEQTPEERRNLLIDRLSEALAQRPAAASKQPTQH